MYNNLFNGIMRTFLDFIIYVAFWQLWSSIAVCTETRRLDSLFRFGYEINLEELTATSLAYLSSMPRFTFNFALSEASHSALRRCCSSSSTNQSILLVAESMMMRSPSFTSAIGPPTRASGTTWPMMNPRLAPENRPSVIRAVEFANPAPAIAPVGPKWNE